MIIKLNTDIAAGCFGLLFCALLWFPQSDLGRLSIIFPRAILLITTLIAVALLIKGLFFTPEGRQVEITGSPRRLLVVMAGFFIWWLLIDILGFAVTSFIAIYLLCWYLARVQGPVSAGQLLRWLPIISVIVGSFYLTFRHLLNVRLPAGLLF
ncbi:hypothetical protein BWR19_04530 [Halomonas sp. 1513]|nr:tripartite tricarboxylate transporter TctB family protein [Halomonas sp. 1513]APX92262.1 hypothetical protein BWR19_04530 [Halomonas sp. 1513]